MNIFTHINDAYLGVLEDVFMNSDYTSAPRGFPIREKVDYSFRILNPTSGAIITRDLERNKVIALYTQKEMDLYNSCSNRVEDFVKASKFWEKLQNPDGTLNSAYGFLIWGNKSHGSFFEGDASQGGLVPVMRTPWEWAKQSLITDKDTRQAILRFSLPQHQWVGNRDQTCTMHGNWLIRDNKLHLSVVMRSCDVVKGLAYDMPFFCSLIDKMVEELKSTYPTLVKGTYTHIVHSIHIYERDSDKIIGMLGL